MPFDRGNVSFTIFELPGELPENFVELIAANKAGTLDSVTGELQLGWVTGHHLLDTAIDDGTAHFGSALYLTLRQAVRKIPASLLAALCQREEQAFLKANPGRDYVPNKERKRIKEEVTDRYLQKMPPSLSGISLAIEPGEQLLFLGATSQSQIDLFIENFFRMTKIEPLQFSPALLLDREFHTVPAEVPSFDLTGEPIAGIEPNIGRDFLTYLLYFSEQVTSFELDGLKYELMVDGPLVLSDDSESNGSGEVTIKNGINPRSSAEIRAALRVGKKLKKAKVLLTRDDKAVWSFTYDADAFGFGSCKLPESEAMDAVEIFEDRLRALSDLKAAWSELFTGFAKAMLENFNETQEAMRRWVKDHEEF